ncbi:MAG TPA: S-layer homology domain-containing protein [Oscillospiraceae bacterium]|nr:S-layer homology domain-containing protein [Oscillospiraceae bacterium]
MKGKLKQSLALILTLALVACLMPTAFAANSVYATGISPNSQSVSLYAGKTTTLTATVTPANYDYGINWATSNSAIVSLEGGATPLSSGGQSSQTIRGAAVGTATVTAVVTKSATEAYTASFFVTVSADSVSSVAMTTSAGDVKTAVNSANLYLGKSIRLYSLVTYASGSTITDSRVTWSSSAPAIVNMDNAGNLYGLAAGTATVTATSIDNGNIYKSIPVTVSSTPAIAISEASNATAVAVGKSLSLTLNSTNGADLAASGVIWSSSDAAIASLSRTSNSLTTTVSGVAGGSATITAKYTYLDANKVNQTVTAAYTVTVNGGDITSIALDSRTYLGLGSYGILTATSKPTNPSYKSISWTSSNPYVATVSGSTLSATIYGRTEGTATVTVTATNTDGSRVYTASSLVTVTDLGSTNVTDTAVNGTNMSLSNISDMLSAKFGRIYGATPSASATITFSSLGSSTYGTLYTSSSAYFWNLAAAKTDYKFSALSSMTFVPSATGDYVLPYTIKDSGTGYTMTGSITITVGTGNQVVTVSLSSNNPYQFGSTVNADGVSAAALIANVVYAKYAKTCGSILLATSATSGVGVLYADSSRTAISSLSSSRTFYYTGSSKLVSSLYFVPSASGTYVRAFTAYDTSGNTLGECELRIIVPDSAISAYYNMKPNTTLSFDQSLFENWFTTQSGADYLAYVTIDGASSSNGTFSRDSTTFAPGSGVKFYSTGYTGTKPTSPSYIGSVRYKSANSSYCNYVNFTCYGGVTSGAVTTVRAGTLAICVTPGTVSDIKYSVEDGAVQSLDSANFTSVYKSATNTTATTAFRVQILDLPANGNLYYAYTSSVGTGTLLTAANCSSFQLYANSSSAGQTIDRLTYVPATIFGSDTVDYAVYNSSGTLLYCGKVVFSSGSTAFSTYSEGYTFKSSDFYSAASGDPIVSLKFGVPSSGALYYNYANGNGVAVASTMRFYTKNVRSGEIAITKLTYIPAAGFTGRATIAYTATTSLGKTLTGTITMNVVGKNASLYFTDVTPGNTGTWAANAIDYCASWGLVGGTGTSTFSPTTTMNRAMLVAVLYKAAGSPSVYGANPFKDVSSSQYYYYAVIWANTNGIVTGTSAKTFSPGGPVTREQIAAILYKYAQYSGTPVTASASLNGYSDRGSVSSYAVAALQWAVGSGIISGTTSTTINPKGNANRAQVAVMLHKYLTA